MLTSDVSLSILSLIRILILIHLYSSIYRELSTHDPKAELGYRVIIAVDPVDPALPLGVTHQPPLPDGETLPESEGLKTSQLEKILVQTVYLRSKYRLAELVKEVEHLLSLECNLQGSPPVLSIPILSPCLR
jgi:mediator of RNA polymerase II transcription subunit 14